MSSKKSIRDTLAEYGLCSPSPKKGMPHFENPPPPPKKNSVDPSGYQVYCESCRRDLRLPKGDRWIAQGFCPVCNDQHAVCVWNYKNPTVKKSVEPTADYGNTTGNADMPLMATKVFPYPSGFKVIIEHHKERMGINKYRHNYYVVVCGDEHYQPVSISEHEYNEFIHYFDCPIDETEDQGPDMITQEVRVVKLKKSASEPSAQSQLLYGSDRSKPIAFAEGPGPELKPRTENTCPECGAVTWDGICGLCSKKSPPTPSGYHDLIRAFRIMGEYEGCLMAILHWDIHPDLKEKISTLLAKHKDFAPKAPTASPFTAYQVPELMAQISRLNDRMRSRDKTFNRAINILLKAVHDRADERDVLKY